MSENIRFPNITAKSEAEQLVQMKSYLHQLVDQLNYALNTVGQVSASSAPMTHSNTSSGGGSTEEKSSLDTFNSIKALIIKSADIVNAYYDEINLRLEGVYVAESDFGAYKEETAADIKTNADNISVLFENTQTIMSASAAVIEVNANLNAGLLGYDKDGLPIYGLEIGQRTEVEGEEVFNKYARFTSDKLSFYDKYDNEVAYVSDKKMFITNIEATGSFTISGFVDTVLSDKSVVTRWVL